MFLSAPIMQVSELVPHGVTSSLQARQSPLDWPSFLRDLTACPNLICLSLCNRHIGRAALELTALTQLQRLVVCGADEVVQECLTASLGAGCALSFPPLP